MPTRKLYVEFDESVAQGAAVAARYSGMSLSQWINAAARHVLVDGYFDLEFDDPSRSNGQAADTSDDDVATVGDVAPAVEVDAVRWWKRGEVSRAETPIEEATELDVQELVWADSVPDAEQGSEPAPDLGATRPSKRAAKRTAKKTSATKTSSAKKAQSSPKNQAKKSQTKKSQAKKTQAKKTQAEKTQASKKATAATKTGSSKKSAPKKSAPAKPPQSTKKSQPASESGPADTTAKAALGARLPPGWQAALNAVRVNQQASTADVAASIDRSRASAIKLLRALERAGLVEWVGTSKHDPRAYWKPIAQ